MRKSISRWRRRSSHERRWAASNGLNSSSASTGCKLSALRSSALESKLSSPLRKDQRFLVRLDSFALTRTEPELDGPLTNFSAGENARRLGVNRVRILVIGPAGVGISSFINSVISV